MNNKDSRLIFENYVDGVTQRKNELAGNIMDIVRHGIPSKEEFIKIRQQLHDLVNMVKARGDKATSEEQDLFNELIGKMRAYRSQHPDDPKPSRDLSKEEDAEENVVKKCKCGCKDCPDRAKEEDAESKFSQTEPLVKQVKMLTNNALRNVFAVIESMENLTTIPYDGELDALAMNLEEEVMRMLDVLKEKMPDTQTASIEDEEKKDNPTDREHDEMQDDVLKYLPQPGSREDKEGYGQY